jgi:hypothetical protein
MGMGMGMGLVFIVAAGGVVVCREDVGTLRERPCQAPLGSDLKISST